MKRYLVGLGVAIVCGAVTKAGAFDSCQVAGGPMRFSSSFHKTITDPSQNQGGLEVDHAGDFDLGRHYLATCSCVPRQSAAYRYYAMPSLPAGHASGWYAVNEYLDVKVYYGVWWATSAPDGPLFYPIPFSNLRATRYYDCDRDGSFTGDDFESGSFGRLDLYVKKPFVGNVSFSREIARIWRTLVDRDPRADPPLAINTISGEVVMPQACEINPGQTISVDFHDIHQKAFGHAGAIAQGVEPVEKTLTLDCTNINDGVDLTLRFVASADAHQPQAIATSNKDIGVVIEDAAGNVVVPNTGLIDVTPSLVNGSAVVNIVSYPIGTTDETPKAGEFDALATMRIDFR